MHGEEGEALIELKMILADFLKKELPYLGQVQTSS